MTVVSNHNHKHNGNIYHDASVYDEVLEPDDDFHSALTAEELLERIHEDIRRKFASRT